MPRKPKISATAQPEGKDAQPKVCNVCHLPYTGDECPVCKAEREYASAVIEERGRRYREDNDSDQQRQ